MESRGDGNIPGVIELMEKEEGKVLSGTKPLSFGLEDWRQEIEAKRVMRVLLGKLMDALNADVEMPALQPYVRKSLTSMDAGFSFGKSSRVAEFTVILPPNFFRDVMQRAGLMDKVRELWGVVDMNGDHLMFAHYLHAHLAKLAGLDASVLPKTRTSAIESPMGAGPEYGLVSFSKPEALSKELGALWKAFTEKYREMSIREWKATKKIFANYEIAESRAKSALMITFRDFVVKWWKETKNQLEEMRTFFEETKKVVKVLHALLNYETDDAIPAAGKIEEFLRPKMGTERRQTIELLGLSSNLVGENSLIDNHILRFTFLAELYNSLLAVVESASDALSKIIKMLDDWKNQFHTEVISSFLIHGEFKKELEVHLVFPDQAFNRALLKQLAEVPTPSAHVVMGRQLFDSPETDIEASSRLETFLSPGNGKDTGTPMHFLSRDFGTHVEVWKNLFK